MDISTIIFTILGAIIIAYIIVQLNKKARKRKAEAERIEKLRQEQINIDYQLVVAKRIKDKAVVEKVHPQVIKANIGFNKLISLSNGYFNNKKLRDWKSSVDLLYKELEKYKIESLQLEKSIIQDIKQFKSNYVTGESIRSNYNNLFIDKELIKYDDFLSNIEGQSLDKQQRLAIIKDEDSNLVIAGAGSGKTTTVAGKVAYLIDRFKISPDEILLITFTKKASDEMKTRIRAKMNIDIEVNTFHSFGRKVIGEATNNMPSVIEDKQLSTEMKSIFNRLFTDSAYADKVIKFITEYRLEPKSDNDFGSHGEYISYLKDNNIKTYKTVEVFINGRRTILREYCKSLEEVKIANYLFLNGIEYKYEEPYKHRTSDSVYAQYKPDFYLPEYDMYIEHFALIDRQNNVPHWFSGGNFETVKNKYNSDIIWKRDTHSKYETTLVETYSYENKEGSLLSNLKVKLESEGVVFKQRTNEEIWGILNSIAKEEVTAFDSLINTFLNLFKSNNFEIDKLIKQVENYEDENAKSRYLLFLDIFKPILINYNNFLKSKNLIDFSDMINDASNYISKNKFANKFKYIIIDEFQDTSIGRYNLINALLKNNNSCKLFAVGDDWQSIYRFAGSDISLFTQFEKYFGFTEVSKIETTYRFSKSMIDLSSKFILTNPNQTKKELKAFSTDVLSPIKIIYSNSFKNDDPNPFIRALQQINDLNVNNKKIKILALARYNHILDLYKERKDLFLVNFNQVEKNFTIIYKEMPELEVQFLSVHRSKGLQGDYVIILNCVSGQYGFPSEQADDPILNLLLSKSDQFLNGEERRLFYVALTRAKKKTFVTTNKTYKSKFINEIDPNFVEDLESKCPVCKSGDVITKEGYNKWDKPYTKYSCSNWNFGCDYLAWG